MLDQREADYDAYNAALLLTLGALGARERLRALLADAVPVMPEDLRDPKGDDDTLHAILGLWATLDRIATHAATVPPRPPTDAAPPAAAPARLMR